LEHYRELGLIQAQGGITKVVFDICVIGGCGHVGLPLSIAFALRSKRVALFDIDKNGLDKLRRGEMPFVEEGGEQALREALASGNLFVASGPEVISESANLVVVMATPIDEHMSPSFQAIDEALKSYREYLCDGQLLILRSTLYPGTAARIQRWLSERGLQIDVAVCPERITQGRGLAEIFSLPQIVSAFSEEAMERARQLFSILNDDVVEMQPLEAELTKLFNNAWRYIKFAVANQYYMIATEAGADFDVIYRGITHNYPRATDFPPPGLAAGPCLFKDTMQLAAFTRNHFMLGHAAMMVNEGLPHFLVSRLKLSNPRLSAATVGILGMAFKANVDDSRDSLSYKLKSLLEMEAGAVLCSDPYVRENGLVPAELLIEKCDIIIIGAPHSVYRELDYRHKKVFDIWGVTAAGTRI
jgi:UDP-N-acetyl-D-mannosaminuronic acid dehydrogenase